MSALFVLLLGIGLSLENGKFFNELNEEEIPINFGSHKDVTSHKGQITIDTLKAEFMTLQGADPSDWDRFVLKSEQAPGQTIWDQSSNRQDARELIEDYDLNQNEVLAMIAYTGGPFDAMQNHFRQQTSIAPKFAHLLYSATHKPYRLKDDRFKNGFTAYTGYEYNADIPIDIDGQNKYVGDTLNGIIMHGPWSFTYDVNIAKEFAKCELPNHTSRWDDAWNLQGNIPPNQWLKNDASVILKVHVPAGKVAEVGIINVEELSQYKREKEYLMFDIPGKFVQIYKVCYDANDAPQSNNNAPQSNNDAPQSNVARAELENIYGLTVCILIA